MVLVWKKKPNLNPARFNVGATFIEGKIYAFGGIAGTSDSSENWVKLVEQFDPSTNEIVLKNDMPDVRQLFATADDGHSVYILGGESNTGFLSDRVELYDPLTDTWRSLPPMLNRRCFFGATFGGVHDSGGYIYAIGGLGYMEGWDLGPIGKAERFKLWDQEWNEIAPLITPRECMGVATGSNGRIYVIGGVSETGRLLDSVEEFNPDTGVWTIKAPMPTKRYHLAAANASDGLIYAIGGLVKHCNMPSSTVEAYNPWTDTWTTCTPMPYGLISLAVVAGYACPNKIYVIGGATKDGPCLPWYPNATVFEGTLTTLTRPSLPTPHGPRPRQNRYPLDRLKRAR